MRASVSSGYSLGPLERFLWHGYKKRNGKSSGAQGRLSPLFFFLSSFFLDATATTTTPNTFKAPVNELQPVPTYTTQTRSRSVASTSVPPALIPQRPAPSPTLPTRTTRPRASISNGPDNAAMEKTVGTRMSKSAIRPRSAWISRRSGGVTPERPVERDTRGSVESIARRGSVRGGRSVS